MNLIASFFIREIARKCFWRLLTNKSCMQFQLFIKRKKDSSCFEYTHASTNLMLSSYDVENTNPLALQRINVNNM